MTAARLASLLLLSSLVVGSVQAADDEFADVRAAIAKNHDTTIKQLREWIAAPAIAAEARGFPDGANRMGAMAHHAGFQHVRVIETDGKPGVFATLDAGEWKLAPPLAKRGYGDIEVNVTGGYDPTSTPKDAPLIQAQVAVLRRAGIEPELWPRNAGSYPGFAFTGEPLKLASGHFGLGHGGGAHAPDEYYVIESSNPALQGLRRRDDVVCRVPVRAGAVGAPLGAMGSRRAGAIAAKPALSPVEGAAPTALRSPLAPPVRSSTA